MNLAEAMAVLRAELEARRTRNMQEDFEVVDEVSDAIETITEEK